MAASKSAHSHLSRSPQNGQTQTHFSKAFPHWIHKANSSSLSKITVLEQNVINAF